MTPEPLKKSGFCLNCKITTSAILHSFISQNDAQSFVWICSRCNRRNPFGAREFFISKEKVESHLTQAQIDALPIIMPDASTRCVRCGVRGSELHHWAPKSMFGADEAEQWPKDYLCKSCHDLWHSVVTPTLVKIERKPA